MTPPLTGFFMRAAGLGKIHKEIEKQKREGGRTGNIGSRPRPLSVGHLGQYQVSRVPSRSVRNNSRLTDRPPPSSREIGRNTHGLTPFPRIHRDDVNREALDEYGLAWDWDPDNEEYIVIKKHLTEQELKELIQHAAWLRERKERDLALLESETEQMRNLSVRKVRGGGRRGLERTHGRDNERESTRGDHVRDRGHAHLPQSRRHIFRDQTQNNYPPAPQELSTERPIAGLPLPSHPRPQRSRTPSMSSRLDQPFSPPDYSFMERPSQPQPQAYGTRSRSGMSQAPAGRPRIQSRQLEESYPTWARAPSGWQGSRPFARAPSVGPSSKRFSHMPASSDHVRFDSPPHHSDSVAGARVRNNEPRPNPLSARQDFTRFARAPSIGPSSRRLSHMQAPPEDFRFASPSHRSDSLAGARLHNERPRQAAEDVRQFLGQQASGSGHLRRERNPDFVRGPESRREYAPAPGLRAEGRDGMGRRDSVRGYREV